MLRAGNSKEKNCPQQKKSGFTLEGHQWAQHLTMMFYMKLVIVVKSKHEKRRKMQ